MEAIAAVLFFANFALSAIAVSLSVMLFRQHRQIGWLLLAVDFLWPFFTLLLRLVHGMPLLTYRTGFGPVVNGVAQNTIHWQFPGFYMIVVAALLLLSRDSRHGK
jgi:hypothetical protein